MSALAPPATYICKYNTVTFPTEMETVDISCKMIESADGRTVVEVEHSLTVHATFATANQAINGTTDVTVANLRKRLTAYAGELVYQNKGYSDLVVNSFAAGVWDTNWGPKPTLLKWKPSGDNQSADILWNVVTR